MTKRKVNVISNKLDQAPKTKAAGYGKVVNLMRKEIINSMNWLNKPNVISNDLDEAPKTRAAGYDKKVLEPIYKDIEEAMDRIILYWSDILADYMNDPKNRIPVQQLLQLAPGDSLSFEVKREKIEYNWWTETVWKHAFNWEFYNFIHNYYTLGEEWRLKPGQISTIIVVEKDTNDPRCWRIHSEQLEYPWEWSMIMPGMFFHDPDVSDDKFQKIIWFSQNEENEEHEENKEWNENSNDYPIGGTEIDESENKDDRKSWKDAIKWWLGK